MAVASETTGEVAKTQMTDENLKDDVRQMK